MNRLSNNLLVVLVSLLCITSKSYGQINNKNEDKVLSELNLLLNYDQKYRLKIMYGETSSEKLDSILELPFEKRRRIMSKIYTDEYSLSKEIVDSLWSLQELLDSTNFIAIESLIKEYGWPNFNNSASQIATAIIMHTNKRNFLSLERMLLKEMEHGRMDAINFAQIWDRLLIEQGEPQLYGTIRSWNKTTKSKASPLILNIEETNKARKKIGLNKLKDYKLIKKKVDAKL